MNEPTERDAVTFKCEQCGRVGGQEMLACPERPLGRCPYDAKQHPVSVKGRLRCLGILLFSIALLVVVCVWLVVSMNNPQEPERIGIYLTGVFIGLVFTSVGLYGILSTRVQLYNPNSRTRWTRTTLLGFELAQTLITSVEPITDLVLSQPLAFPPSVTQLPEAPTNLKKADMYQAVAVFRAALVGLLAQELIRAHRYKKYVARWGKDFKRAENVYVFTTTENADLSSIDGALERKIIKVLTLWTESKQLWVARAGITPIYELIRAVYGKDVSSPAYWVVNLVAKDAVAQGWGRFEGWLRKRFELDATHTDRLRSERAIVSELSLQLAQRQSDFSGALDHQIERAISSREYTDANE